MDCEDVCSTSSPTNKLLGQAQVTGRAVPKPKIGLCSVVTMNINGVNTKQQQMDGKTCGACYMPFFQEPSYQNHFHRGSNSQRASWDHQGRILHLAYQPPCLLHETYAESAVRRHNPVAHIATASGLLYDKQASLLQNKHFAIIKPYCIFPRTWLVNLRARSNSVCVLQPHNPLKDFSAIQQKANGKPPTYDILQRTTMLWGITLQTRVRTASEFNNSGCKIMGRLSKQPCNQHPLPFVLNPKSLSGFRLTLKHAIEVRSLLTILHTNVLQLLFSYMF